MSELRVSYLIGRADRLLRAELESALLESGVSLPEVTALSVLAARPGLSGARLARRALVSPQAMHKVIRSLEDRGLVERSAPAMGGRALETVITDKGARVLEELSGHMDKAEDRFLAPLTDEDRQTLRDALIGISRISGDQGT